VRDLCKRGSLGKEKEKRGPCKSSGNVTAYQKIEKIRGPGVDIYRGGPRGKEEGKGLRRALS